MEKALIFLSIVLFSIQAFSANQIYLQGPNSHYDKNTGAELGYESGRLFTITNTYYSSSDSDIIKLLLVNNGYSVTVSLEFLTSIGARSFKDYLSANDGVKLAIKHYQKYLNASYEYSWNNFTSRPKKAYMYNIFDYKENEYVRLPWKDYSNKSPIK